MCPARQESPYMGLLFNITLIMCIPQKNIVYHKCITVKTDYLPPASAH